ncbi:spore germination protein [Paenibacillus sp. MBLB4367]|uniref:spore germination protein n=1 Tax=Paenibacillus sp. MBLB4367 TaxID=3384767 RepID=UPI00390820DD
MGLFRLLKRKLFGGAKSGESARHKPESRQDSKKDEAVAAASDLSSERPRPDSGEKNEEAGRTPASRILQKIRDAMGGSDDFLYHEFMVGGRVPCATVSIEHMIDDSTYRMEILEPLLVPGFVRTPEEIFRQVAERGQLPVAVTVADESAKVIDAILEGQVAFFVDGEERVMLFPIRQVEKRQIFEALNESVIRGPKEAFVEDIATNLTMIRRKIKTPALQVKRLTFGRLTRTAVVVVYIDTVCKPELVAEVKHRMSRIDIDGVLSANYIEEYIEDNPYSPFPQVIFTERPDSLAAALLEGRVGIIADGSPNPIIVPATFPMMMQSAEDYYQRYIATTWIRWIRFLFLIVSLLLPSLYIAVTTFHPEMMPPLLLTTVAASRENVPFPAIVEALIMEISFEGLREAGLRIPKTIGQTISIIGALIIGQAAVQAGLVSTPMVIVVSITGVASFIIPHYELGLSFRLLRFPVMLLATTFGLFGIIIAVFLIYLHLVTLRSFGTPYMAPIAPLDRRDLKDVFVRVPWWKMMIRPHLFGTKNRQRLVPSGRPISGEEED